MGGILDQRSILSVEEVGKIAEEYGINHRAIGAARPSERVRATPKGWVGVYEDYFKEGFRIPPSWWRCYSIIKYICRN